METTLNGIPRGNLTKENYEFGRNLLKNFMNKKINVDEFYKEVAYFTLNCGFDELIPHPPPTRIQELLDYDNLTLMQRKKMDNTDFWRQTTVFRYVEQKQQIKNQNKANKEWLEELLKRFDSYGDKVCAERVRIRLNEFIAKSEVAL